MVRFHGSFSDAFSCGYIAVCVHVLVVEIPLLLYSRSLESKLEILRAKRREDRHVSYDSSQTNRQYHFRDVMELNHLVKRHLRMDYLLVVLLWITEQIGNLNVEFQLLCKLQR